MKKLVIFLKTIYGIILFSFLFSDLASPALAASKPTLPGRFAFQTWVITPGTKFSIAGPPGTGETRKEIAELLKLQNERSTEVLQTVNYWDSGSPNYRWNQIAFKVATESSAPIVTERMLALLNVAIYDALVAARDLKTQYNRPRPGKIANKLKLVVPDISDSSYPSEHAVVAGAASVLLSYLCPNKAQFLSAKAEEAAQSRLMAGVNYKSDITAGLELGRQVAALVIEKAKQDGSDAKWTGSVPNNPGLWNGKNPASPEIATWKTWVLSSPDQLRPPAPPVFDKAAMTEVKEATNKPVAKREAYYWAITSLPKFWNELLSLKLFESKIDRDPLRSARAYAVLSTAYHDSLVANWDAKYAYWGQRPFQFDPEFKPLITTPNFPGYPSGHANMSGTAGAILSYLFPRDTEFFNQQAEAAANSRLLAGVHFRVDNEVGLALGRSVAALAIERAKKDGFDSPGK